jgi:MFS family permease
MSAEEAIVSGDAPDSKAAQPEPPRWALDARYRWHLVAMLWCISFFNYADRNAISTVLPLLQRDLSLTDIQAGIALSAFAWVYGLCAPFAGYVVDRVRRKTAILGGLHIWSVICMATALSRTYFQLVVFRAAEGLGETFYYPASVSMISDYHGQRTRSRALGIHQTSVYVGTIGGAYFAGLIGQHYGWRSSFVVFGGLGILLGVVLRRFLVEPRRGAADSLVEGQAEASPARQLPFREILAVIGKTPAILALMLAFVCANFVATLAMAWMPTFVLRKFGLDLAASGLTATVYIQLASMAGSPLGGWLADLLRQRTSRGRILVQALGVFGAAPFVFWCGQAPSMGGLILALTAWGLFKGVYDANIFASVFDLIPPEARGTLAGFMNLVGWLGGGTAPWVISLLAEDLSLGRAISSSAVVYVAAGVLLLAAAGLAGRPRGRPA